MLNIDFNKLINWQYISGKPPAEMDHFAFITLFLAGVACIAIILWLVKKWKIKISHNPTGDLMCRASIWLFYPAIFGLLLLFLRIQGITFTLWRILMLVLLVLWIIAILYVLQYAIFGYPLAVRKQKAKALKDKYMPKSKQVRR